MPATAARTIDSARLMRAMRLLPFVERLGPMQFRVPGQEEPFYYVDLTQDPPCMCKDQEFAASEGRQCKHILATRWLNRDLPVLLAAGEILLKAEKAMQEYAPEKEED